MKLTAATHRKFIYPLTWLKWLMMLVLVLMPFLSSANMTPAYSVIKNKATVIYYNDELNIYERVDTNTVEVVVAPIASFMFVQDETVMATVGGEVIISHQLINTGNVPLEVTLSWLKEAASAFGLNNLAIYIDVNKNGTPNDNDLKFASGQTLPELPIGSSYSLLLVGDVPNSASIGSSAIYLLTAAAVGSKGETVTSASVTDTINVSDMSGLRLFKEANVAKATPNTPITFTINAIQASGIDTLPTGLEIDGVTQAKVFIRDSIPSGTVFTSITTTAGAQVLYHVTGVSNDNYYTTAPPANLANVDAIAFAWDNFPTGVARSVSFVVTPKDNLSQNVTNQAVAYQNINGGSTQTKSNTVVLPASTTGNISFYKNDSFGNKINAEPPREPLYIAASAQACNDDPTRVESYLVTVTSSATGDIESQSLVVETGVNTGFFTLIMPTQLWSDKPVAHNDGTLSEGAQDTITVTLICQGNTYSSTLTVDSGMKAVYNIEGTLFDSRNIGKVIPNTVIELYSTTDSAQTTVYSLATPASTSLVTTTTSDANGRYQFRNIPVNSAENFLVKVIPNNYTYPSVYSASLYTTYNVNPYASYERPFNFAAAGTYTFDIPLDYTPPAGAGLVIEKQANKEFVEYGQVLTYTIKYKNKLTNFTYEHVTLDDTLPRGFAYISGTAKRTPSGGSAIVLADPAGAPGRNLAFNIGEVKASEEGTITYLVQVRNSAPLGKATNVAIMTSPEGNSNSASVSVNVRGGVFSDEAFILGTIFADCNNNKQKDPDELGIPFVRMYLEDGTFVISDAEGRFSLYGLTPRTHVMKIDTTTLPTGAKLQVLNNRFANDAGSTFVDLKKGELHRTDFAISNCTAEIREEIEKRRGTWTSDEVSNQLQTISDSSLSSLEPYQAGDLKARPAAGVIKPDGQVVTETLALPATNAMTGYLDEWPPQNSTSATRTAPAVLDMEEVLKTASNNSIDFIDLKEGDVLTSPQMTIRVKGVAGTQLALKVNDKLVDESRVGQRSVLQNKQIEAWSYIGVNLKPGNNKLEASIIDNFGNQRERKTIHVMAPGELDKIMIQPVREAVADGITPLPIVVRLVDSNGVKVFGRSAVLLETTAGRWDVANSKASNRGGIEVFVENGEGTFNLITNEPGKVSVRATVGLIKQVQDIRVSANLRPLIAVGVIEGAIGLRDLKDGNIEGISNGDNFEQSIRTAFGDKGEAGSVGLRGAMFLKGKVKGDYLLTLAYDSDKHLGNEMFRDIDPNKYYPVYGDDSIRGFDAQATSDLYVRVDKGNSFILYGDYSTQDNTFSTLSTVKGKSLGSYQRNLTGLKGQYENDRLRITYFAAYEDTRQVVKEFAGRGISGPYDITMSNFISNSEVVTILTRSKSQPGLILKREQLARFTDYSFDAFVNTILFSRPIPSVDENGNPVSIQISYEVDNGGEKYWVYGGDGDVKVGEMVTLGGSYVEDKNPTTQFRLTSVHSVFEITPNVGVALEWARSKGYSNNSSADAGTIGDFQSGNAYRAEMIASTEDKKLESRVYMTRADGSFENDGAGVTAGRDDGGVIVNYRIAEGTALHAEALYTKDTSSGTSGGSERYGGLFSIEQSLTSTFAGRLGTRYVREKSDRDTFDANDLTSIFARLMWTPETLPELRTFIEGEKSVSGGNGSYMLAAGAEYAVSKEVSLYGRHEFVSELGLGSTNSVNGQFGTSGNTFDSNKNATTLGVKYNYAASGDIFSEYRIVNAIDGRQAEGSMGVNHGWEIADGLKMNTTFERIQPFGSGGNNDGLASAATIGFDYTAPEFWKGTTRLEWRRSSTTQSWLHTLGLAYKLNKDWTALASNIYGYESSLDDSGDRRRDDARIGFAYRDTANNKLNALMRYQLLIDDNSGESSNSTSHVLTGLANYQFNPALILSGRYAISRTNNNDEGIDSNVTSQLVMGRFTYDINDRWDIGLMGSRLFGDGASRSGYGAEVGYLVGKNIWFSTGYNFVGFRDNKLTGSDYTQEGLYIRLRIKFDENMFGWLTE